MLFCRGWHTVLTHGFFWYSPSSVPCSRTSARERNQAKNGDNNKDDDPQRRTMVAAASTGHRVLVWWIAIQHLLCQKIVLQIVFSVSIQIHHNLTCSIVNCYWPHHRKRHAFRVRSIVHTQKAGSLFWSRCRHLCQPGFFLIFTHLRVCCKSGFSFLSCHHYRINEKKIKKTFDDRLRESYTGT